MADNTNSQQQPPEPSPALEHLNALVGEWTIEATVPSDPPLAVRGRATFEWLTGGSFLVQSWDVAHPDFPDGIAIIGSDASAEAYRQHYFDSRGVSRVYEMSLRATSGNCGETRRTSRNVSRERSATVARRSRDAGRSQATGRIGNTTSTSRT